MMMTRIQSQIRACVQLWPALLVDAVPVDLKLRRFFLRYRKKFGSRDRRFISDVVYAALRHKTCLETWKNAWSGNDPEVHFMTAAAVRAGGITREDFGRLIPGSEGDFTRIESGLLPEGMPAAPPVLYSFPEWLYERWSRMFGNEEAEKILRSLNQKAPLAVRANTLKSSRDSLQKRMRQLGYECRAGALAKTALVFPENVPLKQTKEFKEGLFEFQDEGSQWMCDQMHPEGSKRILDLCAGAGGKTLALAAAVKNEGRITACDKRASMLEELKRRARRAGVRNLEVKTADEILARKAACFDMILIDAPCSGTGTIRRNPALKWQLNRETFESCAAVQTALVRAALRLLLPGGVLNYVTCSVDREENESLMRAILNFRPDLTLEREERLWPHKSSTDGFYWAALRS